MKSLPKGAGQSWGSNHFAKPIKKQSAQKPIWGTSVSKGNATYPVPGIKKVPKGYKPTITP
jgi:hypothetical protein